MELSIEESLVHFPLILILILQFKLSIEPSKGIYPIYLFSSPFPIIFSGFTIIISNYLGSINSMRTM